MIKDEKDLLEHLSAESRQQAERHVYKYTDCGAWIEFLDDGIRLGSIVEGCDFGTATYKLTYPFEPGDYDARIEAIEKEASATWEWANVERDNGQTDAEMGIDAPDVGFEYSHWADGRSS